MRQWCIYIVVLVVDILIFSVWLKEHVIVHMTFKIKSSEKERQRGKENEKNVDWNWFRIRLSLSCVEETTWAHYWSDRKTMKPIDKTSDKHRERERWSIWPSSNLEIFDKQLVNQCSSSFDPMSKRSRLSSDFCFHESFDHYSCLTKRKETKSFEYLTLERIKSREKKNR